jgi:hypothetical protein
MCTCSLFFLKRAGAPPLGQPWRPLPFFFHGRELHLPCSGRRAEASPWPAPSSSSKLSAPSYLNADAPAVSSNGAWRREQPSLARQQLCRLPPPRPSFLPGSAQQQVGRPSSPKSREQPLPFFLQRPVRFSSSRLPFFTWTNTAPCPWMQQQQPPLLPHKTAAPDPLQIACFVRSAQSRPTPSCWCLGQLHAASSLCAVRPSTRLTSPDLRSPNIDAVHPGETTMIFV